MAELGEAVIPIRAKLDELNKDLAGVRGQVSKAVEGAAAAGGAVVATGFVAAGAAAVKFGKESADAFVGFQDQMNEVFTLLPGISQDAMDSMSADVLQFAKDFGTLPNEVVPALYQSLSAGVPPGNVFDFLETAQKAAVGGVTELETAVDGISSVVNAYGSDVIDAAKASDLMFTAVRLGKTNFEELSQSLYNVIPTAASLGVGFEDITAALAAMTAQGTPTAVATTQLRQLLVELSKDGSKAADMFESIAGQSFADFIAAGGNVQDALTLMDQGAQDAGLRINDLFGSVEAGNAALALTGGGAETFSANLAQMADSAGATNAAFEQMNTGLQRSRERAAAVWETIKIGVGGALEPLLSSLADLAESALPFLEEVMAKITPVIADFAAEFGEKLGPALEIIGGNVRRIADALGLTNEEMSDSEAIAAALKTVLDSLTTGLEALAVVSEGVAFVFEKLGPGVWNLLNPFKGLVDSVKELKTQLADLQLPDWLTPGSPTPLQLGLEGINAALNAMPALGAKFETAPAFGGDLSAGGGIGGNTTIVNIDGVTAMSQGGDSADEAIRLTVQLLRQQLKGQGA